MKIIQVLDHDTFGSSCAEVAKQSAGLADMLWLRIKDPEQKEEKAEKLRKYLPGACLTLSLDAELAYRLGYDAVHLGAGSDIAEVRRKYPDLTIGYSAHSLEEILAVDADYYTLSPIFFTQKDYEVKPLGVVDVSAAGKEIYALGGVNSGNAAQLIGKGYAGIAGISFHRELADLRRIISG